ncbi:MAG TPA: histidine phosphatase family protein, partial [Gaiellaceae bacterium]
IEPESRYALREIESGDIRSTSADEVQAMMTAAFKGVVPLDTHFLGGETTGELVDRVTTELDALVADQDWDVVLLVLHGAVNRAILSRALTGERMFLGAFEQAPGCINVLDVGDDDRWVVRGVNHIPYDPVHAGGSRLTTMEHLWQEYVDSQA